MIAFDLVRYYNDSPTVEEPYDQISREASAHWEVPVDGESPIEIFQFIDGTLAVIPEGSSGTAIDPSTGAIEHV